MSKAKRTLIVADITLKPVKMLLDQMSKLAKGFIRLGRAHREFNSVKIAGYLLDLVEKGGYSAPWLTGS